MATDYYAILGVDAQADQAALEAAYSRLAEQYSAARLAELAPDLRRLAEERWAAIDTAYAVLSDSGRRAAYEAGRAAVMDSAAQTQKAAVAGGRGRRKQAAGQPDREESGRLPALWRSPWIALGFMLTGLVALVVTIVLLVTTGSRDASGAAEQQRSGQWSNLPAAVQKELADPGILDLLAKQEQRITNLDRIARQNPKFDNWVSLGHAIFDYVEVIRTRSLEGEAYAAVAPRWLEAAAAYTNALQLRPDVGEVRSDYAISLLRYGQAVQDSARLRQAVSEAERALRDDPEGLRTMLNAGIVLSIAEPSRTQEAQALWKAIADRAPESQEGKAASALLAGQKP